MAMQENPSEKRALQTLLTRSTPLIDIAINSKHTLKYLTKIGALIFPLPTGLTRSLTSLDIYLAEQIITLNPCPSQLLQIFPNVHQRLRYSTLLLTIAQYHVLSTKDWDLWNATIADLMTLIAGQGSPNTSAFMPLIDLPITDCKIPIEYQRDIIPGHLKELEKKFDVRALEPITVNRRNTGELMVVDGQHRLLLAQHTGSEVITSKIYKTPLTVPEEARQHLLLGRGHSSLSLYSALKTRLAENDPTAVHLNHVVEQAGYHIAKKSGKHLAPGIITAVGAVEALYKKDQGITLQTILKIINDSWGTQGIISKILLEGLDEFCDTYREVYRYNWLIERLRLENSQLLGQRAVAEAQYNFHSNIAGARILVRLYNHHRATKNQLKLNWLEDGRPTDLST